jgi:hypothetical protein
VYSALNICTPFIMKDFLRDTRFVTHVPTSGRYVTFPGYKVQFNSVHKALKVVVILSTGFI